MSTAIVTIMVWFREIKMIVIAISYINTELPTVTTGINRAVKILCLQETTVLHIIQYPAKVVITVIKQFIICHNGPFFASHNIIHEVTYSVYKVKVYFVYIIILWSTQVKLISHFICKETTLFTHFAVAHSGHAHATHGSHSDGEQDQYHSFHNSSFYLFINNLLLFFCM